MKRTLAHAMRRAARALIRQSNKLEPPEVKSPAQQGLDIAMAHINADNAERMRIDMEYHVQMAALG